MKKSSFLLLIPASLLLIGASAYAATDSKASTPNYQMSTNFSGYDN